MTNNTLLMIKISKIIQENPQVKTFYFDFELNSQPGQFVMLWIPGIDQKPFSISSDDGQTFGLTIFKRGHLTTKLFEMKVGDRIGISGPFGTAFSIKPNTHHIMVAGGYGAAPLAFLASTLIPNEVMNLSEPKSIPPKIDFLIGAKSKNLLIFEDYLSKIPNLKLHIATDDGSKGYKGYVTDILSVILNEVKDLSKPLIDEIQNSNVPQNINPPKDSSLTLFVRNEIASPRNQSAYFCVCCGPELMEKKVLDICNEYNVECEISIERYMKCGYGVCGQCAVDDLGICMCTYGPVVNRELANKIVEFGKYHRDKAGEKIFFNIL